MMFVSHEVLDATALVGCSVTAAVVDVRERRIPNKLCAVTLLGGVLLHAVEGGAREAGWALLAGLIAGAIFMVFHLAGGMGAGDVKLMAGLGCIAGTADVCNLLIATAVLGAVCALALAISRGMLRRTLGNMLVLVAHHRVNGMAAHPELNVANESTLRLPYAVPMAMASALVLVMHLVQGGAR
jgi:prepilin peptidase CpaA